MRRRRRKGSTCPRDRDASLALPLARDSFVTRCRLVCDSAASAVSPNREFSNLADSRRGACVGSARGAGFPAGDCEIRMRTIRAYERVSLVFLKAARRRSPKSGRIVKYRAIARKSPNLWRRPRAPAGELEIDLHLAIGDGFMIIR